MPVMPGYLYADTPHEKTVTGADYRYGCHTSLTADGGPRGVRTKYYAHPWSHQHPEFIVTDWLPMRCGHTTRSSDGACEGCENRRENNGEVLSKSLDQLPATS